MPTGVAVGLGLGVTLAVAVAVGVGVAVGLPVGVDVGVPPSEVGSLSWKASCWELPLMALRPSTHEWRCWVSTEEPES